MANELHSFIVTERFRHADGRNTERASIIEASTTEAAKKTHIRAWSREVPVPEDWQCVSISVEPSGLTGYGDHLAFASYAAFGGKDLHPMSIDHPCAISYRLPDDCDDESSWRCSNCSVVVDDHQDYYPPRWGYLELTRNTSQPQHSEKQRRLYALRDAFVSDIKRRTAERPITLDVAARSAFEIACSHGMHPFEDRTVRQIASVVYHRMGQLPESLRDPAPTEDKVALLLCPGCVTSVLVSLGLQ